MPQPNPDAGIRSNRQRPGQHHGCGRSPTDRAVVPVADVEIDPLDVHHPGGRHPITSWKNNARGD